jgi:DNA adenine methylase
VLARYTSPLRYPGGKAKVTNFLKLLLLENSLVGIDYVEPYAGGASAALSLLYEDYVDTIQINDLYFGVYCFWQLALNDPSDLCRRIKAVPLTVDEWKRQREIYQGASSDPSAIGFASFFLNRTNRSGIVSGGVIGGLDQTGPWKIDARFGRNGLCERIKKLSRFSDRITVTNEDAAKLLKRYRRSRQRKLLYLDPPYYVKGSRLYDNFYSHGDPVIIRDLIIGLRGPWVVSYDSAPQIIELYRGQSSRLYSLGYSAGQATTGSEAMFFSEDLAIPDVSSPAGIRAADVIKARRLVYQGVLDL